MPRFDLRFLHGQSIPECRHVVDKAFDGYQTLQYMSAGAVDLAIGARRYALEGRWFWSAYPGPRIRFNVAAGQDHWRHRYIAFAGPLVARWTEAGLFPVAPLEIKSGKESVKSRTVETSATTQVGETSAKTQAIGGSATPVADHSFSERFDQLLELSLRSDQWGHLRGINVLESILIDLADLAARPGPSDPWLEQALRTIEAAQDRADPDYDSLAVELGMSPSTLRRRFRRATGMTPHDYLIACRVSSARQMLGQTDLPIKSIAQRLGYADVFFFSRQFRQRTGVSPGAYRKSRQGENDG